MGTEEKEPEAMAGESQPIQKDLAVLEKDTDPQSPETSECPNNENGPTSTQGTTEGDLREEAPTATASPASTLEKLQKASTNKWKTMQNWRKALSEDTGDKSASGRGGEGAKDTAKSYGGGKKNRFKRAQSEPPGGLFSSLIQAPPSSSSSSAAEGGAGGSPSSDPAQKGTAGGGALFKKYLRSMSQKLRPRLTSRTSNPALLTDVVEAEPGQAAVAEVRPNWAPAQEVPLWDISNCVLEHGQILIAQEEEPTMWTRNRVSSFLSNLSMQNLLDIECSPDNVALAGPRPKNQDGSVMRLIKKRREHKAKRNSSTQPLELLKSKRYKRFTCKYG